VRHDQQVFRFVHLRQNVAQTPTTFLLRLKVGILASLGFGFS
jgi:hypothetical protein